MLASGAHIDLDGTTFQIAFAEERAYAYTLENKETQPVFWLMNDWSGGEGNDVFDPEDPTVYHKGLVNSRRPGILTSPPTRAVLTTASLSPAPNIGLSAVAKGRLYLIGEQVTSGETSYWYTTDYASFVEVEDDGWDTDIETITAVCTDGEGVYIAGYDSATNGFAIRRLNSTFSQQDIRILNSGDDEAIGRIIGMGVINDTLFYWTGARLFRRAIHVEGGADSGADEFQVRKIGPIAFTMTYGTDYWGGLVNAEGSLYFFVSTEGRTILYQTTRAGVTNEIWYMQGGFTGKSIGYQSGAVLIAGEYLGQAAVYAMGTVSRQQMFLGYLRYGETLSPEIVGNGFGSEVIIAEKDVGSGGKLFVYDVGLDAFSELDEITHTSGELWSVGTFKNRRYAVVEDGTDLNLYSWTADSSPSTAVDGVMESGVYDFDTPEDEKQLDGFHVLSDADGDKDFNIEYQLDEDGVWLEATAEVGNEFHEYQQLTTASATVKFRALRLRVTAINGCTVYSVSTRARINTYIETWEILIDLTDETVEDQPSRRRRDRSDRGYQQRDRIRQLATTKDAVLFKDGARYPASDRDNPDQYSQHLVNVDIPIDTLDRPGEGFMLVRLTSVDVN